MALTYITPKDKNFKTCHEILDLGIAQNIIQGLQQYQVSNIIAEVKIMFSLTIMIQDYLKVFQWVIQEFKLVIYLST